MDILCNYQLQKSATLILVFDAYRVSVRPGSIMRCKFTTSTRNDIKEAETADMVHLSAVVPTIGAEPPGAGGGLDGNEQVIILKYGALRVSAGCSTKRCRMWKKR